MYHKIASSFRYSSLLGPAGFYNSKKLAAPEVILQTADVLRYEHINESSKIIDDDIIAKEASLAKALLDDKMFLLANKTIIGIPERHNDALEEIPFLCDEIKLLLK